MPDAASFATSGAGTPSAANEGVGASRDLSSDIGVSVPFRHRFHQVNCTIAGGWFSHGTVLTAHNFRCAHDLYTAWLIAEAMAVASCVGAISFRTRVLQTNCSAKKRTSVEVWRRWRWPHPFAVRIFL